MTNDLYVQFHSATVRLVENFGVKALGIEQTTLDDYKAVVEAEHDYVNRSFKSVYTTRLAELDERRVDLTRCIVARCRAAKSSSVDKVKEAAEELKRTIVDEYPLSTMKKASQRKTTVITGLVVDLKKFDEDVLKALGIDAMVGELEDTNESYAQAYLARNAEYDDRGLGEMKGLREAGDELYRALVLQVTSVANRSDKALAAIADPTEQEKAMAQRLVAYRFVGQLNQHIKNYKARYLKRGSGSMAEDDEAEAPDAADDAGSIAPGSDNSVSDAEGGTDSKPTGPTDVTEVFE